MIVKSLQIMVVGLLISSALHAGQLTLLNRTGNPVLVEIIGKDGKTSSATVPVADRMSSVESSGTTLAYKGFQPRQITLTNTRTKKKNVYRKRTYLMKPGGGNLIIRRGFKGKPRLGIPVSEIGAEIVRQL